MQDEVQAPMSLDTNLLLPSAIQAVTALAPVIGTDYQQEGITIPSAFPGCLCPKCTFPILHHHLVAYALFFSSVFLDVVTLIRAPSAKYRSCLE